MNVVDSSAWLEYCANGPNASFFGGPIEEAERLVVPSLTIHEAFKCSRAWSSISMTGLPCPRRASAST